MTKQFKLQDPGEGVHEAEIVEVTVSEGDQVSEGDVVLEIETDKAGVEVPSPFSGTIKEIHVESGEIVEVGALLITFEVDADEEPGEEDSSKKEEKGGEKASKSKRRRKGRKDKKDASPEGDADAPGDGASQKDVGNNAAKEQEKQEQDKAAPKGGDKQKKPKGKNGRTKDEEKTSASDTPVPASPATRRMAREQGVDLRKIDGGGPGGRVTAEDVRRAAEGSTQEQESSAKAKQDVAKQEAPDTPGSEGEERVAPGIDAGAPSLPDFSRWGKVEREPLRGVRRATANQMTLAWSQIPHVTHQDVADITELDKFRQQANDVNDASDHSVSITVLALKAVASALREFPTFNASLDPENGEIVLKKYYHLGVAVDTDKGLLVPVVRDVDRKSVQELSEALAQIAKQAREGKLEVEDMEGGSFTITNPGPIGGTSFTPIINYPEVAILGLGQARLQTVVEGTLEKYTLTPRLLLPICLAFDHRVNDGAEAARFVNHVRELLADPESFLMGV